MTASVSIFQYNEQGLKIFEQLNEFNRAAGSVLPVRRTYYIYNADNLLLADTVYRYDIVDAVYNLSTYTIREYPSDLDNGTYLAYKYNYKEGEWTISSKTEIDRVNGLITREANYLWDSSIEEYRMIALDETTYDEDNNILSFRQFDVVNETLKPFFGRQFEYQNGLLWKRWDYTVFNPTGEYLPRTQAIFEYDTDNKLSLISFSRFDFSTGNEMIIPATRERYEYADNGDLIHLFNDRWVSSDTNYSLSERFDYQYDDFKNRIQSDSWEFQNSDFVLVRKTVRLFDYDFENGEYTTEPIAISGTHMLLKAQSFIIRPDLEEVLNSEFRYIYKFETVQTEQLSDSNEFLIYPNPVSHTLNINNEDDGFHKVHIYNQLGFLVYKGNISDSSSVDVQHLQEGVYYLQLIHPSTGQNQTLRFVKL
jgi:hypothetical protein